MHCYVIIVALKKYININLLILGDLQVQGCCREVPCRDLITSAGPGGLVLIAKTLIDK